MNLLELSDNVEIILIEFLTVAAQLSLGEVRIFFIIFFFDRSRFTVLLLLQLQEGDNYKARFGEIKCTRTTDNRSKSGTPALPTSERKPVSDEGIWIWTSAFGDGRHARLCVSQTLAA